MRYGITAVLSLRGGIQAVPHINFQKTSIYFFVVKKKLINIIVQKVFIFFSMHVEAVVY